MCPVWPCEQCPRVSWGQRALIFLLHPSSAPSRGHRESSNYSEPQLAPLYMKQQKTIPLGLLLRSPVLHEQFQAPGQLPTWGLPSKASASTLCMAGVSTCVCRSSIPPTLAPREQALPRPTYSSQASQDRCRGHPLEVNSSCGNCPFLVAAL